MVQIAAGLADHVVLRLREGVRLSRLCVDRFQRRALIGSGLDGVQIVLYLIV